MSVQIIYDRQVVKTSLGLCWLTLWGDSRWYDRGWSGRDRRERHWHCLYFNVTEEKAMQEFEEWSKTISDSYWFGSKPADGPTLLRWAAEGLKKAKTIEQFVGFGKDLCGEILWRDSSDCSHSEKTVIASDEAYVNWWEAASRRTDELIAEGVDQRNIYKELRFWGEEPLRLNRPQKESVEGPVVIKLGKKYFHSPNQYAPDRHGYCLTAELERAFRFSTLEEAKETWNHCRLAGDSPTFHNYDELLRRKETKKFAIRFVKGGLPYFVTKKTKGHWHYSSESRQAALYTLSEARKKLDATCRLADKTIVASIVEIGANGVVKEIA